MKKKVIMKQKLMSIILATVMVLTAVQIPPQKVEAATLNNPRIVEDSNMIHSKQRVTWDCIWFGSYPQREVVAEASQSGVYGRSWSTSDDYIVDASLYSALSNATGWNSNDDLTFGNAKYRRMWESDATYGASGDSDHYKWSDRTTIHYFKYEPIKWRVLKVSGSSAFLLAEKALDDQKYNVNETTVTWENSGIRSWLNGYGAGVNQAGTDYTSKNFLKCAFSASEQNAIQTTNVINKNNLSCSTNGGNNTSDKVFLLSEEEVYTDTAKGYGFDSNTGTWDEARGSKSSTYAKAMGTSSYPSSSYLGNCCWWLRSPGLYTNHAVCVNMGGSVEDYGYYVDCSAAGCRPALNLNLSSSNLWTYAGTVSSDGTENGEAYEPDSSAGADNDGHFAENINPEDYAHVSDEDYFLPEDTNHFKHSNTSFYSHSINNDEIVFDEQTVYNTLLTDTSYRNKLLENTNVWENKKIQSELLGNWGGVCYGLDIAMITASTHHNNRGITDNFWSSGAPLTNNELKNKIAFYHLSQYRNNLKHSEINYRDTLNNFFIGMDISEIISDIKNEAKQSVRIQSPFIISVGYTRNNEDKGHSVVACGYTEERKEGYTESKIKIFDPNTFTGNIDILESVYYYWMTIRVYDDGKCTFKLPTNSKIITNDNYRYLAFTSSSRINSTYTGDNLKTRPALNMLSADYSGSEEGKTNLTISPYKKCLIKNSEGKYLKFDGTKYTGNMVIYDANLYGEEKLELDLIVPQSDKFTVTDIESEFSIGTLIKDRFKSIAINGANKVEISYPSLSVEGKNVNYTAYVDSNLQSTDLVKISGDSSNDLQIMNDNSGINIQSSTSCTNTEIMANINGKLQIKNIDSKTNNISISDSGNGLSLDRVEDKIHTHIWNSGIITKQPTTTSTGVKTFTCSTCGETRTETIPKLAAPTPVANIITASDITRIYSTGAQSFNIGASCLGGAKLTYTSNNSNITVNSAGQITVKAKYMGQAVITITSSATAQYKAAMKQITVIVTPKKTTISKVTSSKKKTLKVTWKKNATASGYQVYVSTSKTFASNTKACTVKGQKKLSATATKLKSKKKYYAKVRAYKTVSGKKIYGPWSAVKACKVK